MYIFHSYSKFLPCGIEDFICEVPKIKSPLWEWEATGETLTDFFFSYGKKHIALNLLS